ncbi:hypothetical protein [Paraburkholderia youngii]|uniref:hypothetical protein n=1 Tax=Paraburkholderia youngii TaxID=2782701 RepID=UPI003D22D2CD
MHDLWIVAGTLVVSWTGDRALKWWLRRDQVAQLHAAHALLARHGLDAHRYVPGLGVRDPAMHGALDRVASSGMLIIDREGRLVGGLMPKLVKGPHLRLVVDNTQ